MKSLKYTCLDRFLNYITFDTQSSEDSGTFPSTEKQKVLAAYLVKELEQIGLKDAEMDNKGYVWATLPSNVDHPTPVIGLIAHLDTSPDVSGKDIKPVFHRNYYGRDIIINEKENIKLLVNETPELQNKVGEDIITSDGTTLLGADDKAGIAEIFDAVHHLVNTPAIKHGTIKIAITPDEEIGRGADHFDTQKFGADYAYTIDGEELGEIVDETFCADTVHLTIKGVNMHPGYAKNKLLNAIKVSSELINSLPKHELSPETTEKRQGYIHPNFISGGVESIDIKFLIRDFTVEGLEDKEKFLKNKCEQVILKYPNAKFDFKIKEFYRNMKYQIDKDYKVVEYAKEAILRSGIKPKQNLIRGGTDGARLSYKGLLTPNLFAGGHNFHSKQEWISVQDMQKAVDVIINLVQIWEEKSR